MLLHGERLGIPIERSGCRTRNQTVNARPSRVHLEEVACFLIKIWVEDDAYSIVSRDITIALKRVYANRTRFGIATSKPKIEAVTMA